MNFAKVHLIPGKNSIHATKSNYRFLGKKIFHQFWWRLLFQIFNNKSSTLVLYILQTQNVISPFYCILCHRSFKGYFNHFHDPSEGKSRVHSVYQRLQKREGNRNISWTGNTKNYMFDITFSNKPPGWQKTRAMEYCH